MTGTGGPLSQGEFTKIQELLYELRVEQIMTAPVFTLEPDAHMSEAKEAMRTHRFSGLPIHSGEQLVGVVSVEDVIRWLEAGAPSDSISKWMSSRVHTLSCDEAAIRALTMFDCHKVGRLPVLDVDDRLVGIVTPGDIIGRILRVLDSRYREEEGRRPRTHITMQDLVSDDSRLSLKYRIEPRDFRRAGGAATAIKRTLDCFGLPPRTIRRAAIAAFESEMNLAIHATHGGRIDVLLTPEMLSIEASDLGPGIQDLERAMTPGFSTAPDWIRELGFGAGMGLSNIKLCSDEFAIKSEWGEGTNVRIGFRLGDGR